MALATDTQIEVKSHRFTLEEYERAIEAGIFDPDARIELLDGVVVDMPPPGPTHEDIVTALHILFYEQTQRRALVWPQGNSILLPNSNSRPQPDVTILKWRDDLYRGKQRSAEDVLVVVEVSDSSVKIDQGVKLRLYAEAGIPEYWIVNVNAKTIDVYTEPSGNEYLSSRKAKAGDIINLPAPIEGSIKVSDIVG